MYALLSASSGLFLSRNVLLGLSSVLPLSLSPTPPWFFHRKPFVLSKQTLICTSHSKLQQGCQVSILTPARNSCSSGPEQQTGTVCAVLLPYGPLVQQARGWSPEHKCLPCWLEVLRAAACWLMITCIMTPRIQMLPGMREVWELPTPSLAGWRNPYLPACRQQRQREPESVWSKDAYYNPSNFNTQEGDRRASCAH